MKLSRKHSSRKYPTGNIKVTKAAVIESYHQTGLQGLDQTFSGSEAKPFLYEKVIYFVVPRGWPECPKVMSNKNRYQQQPLK